MTDTSTCLHFIGDCCNKIHAFPKCLVYLQRFICCNHSYCSPMLSQNDRFMFSNIFFYILFYIKGCLKSFYLIVFSLCHLTSHHSDFCTGEHHLKSDKCHLTKKLLLVFFFIYVSYKFFGQFLIQFS